MSTPPLADLDPVQITLVVIAMLAGFVQWLWNLIKQSQSEAARRQAPPPSEEEKRQREEAWKRQVQGGAPPPRPSPPSTAPVNDPFATVREIFEQIKREALDLPKPQPPPLQQRQPSSASRRGTTGSEVTAPPYKPSARRSSVREQARPAPSSATIETAPPPSSPPVTPVSTPLNPEQRPQTGPAWAALLGSASGLKQAFILSDILGPPKALQSARDSAA